MATQEPRYTLTNESITVVVEGKPHTVAKGMANFAPLREALLSKNWDKVPGFLTIEKSLESWTKGKFSTGSSGEILFDGRPMPRGLSERIQAMMTRGESAEPLLNFWERLQKNPSWRSVEQLWPFLDRSGIPLTKDGCFLAYKGVNDDYTDRHSGKIDNSPGVINSMPRNQVSDDPDVSCHYGFHVGAIGYARSFASKTIVCKVDPADVVCIPNDFGQQKIRCCRYRVVGNYGEQLPDTFLDEPIVNVPVVEPEAPKTVVKEKAQLNRKNKEGKVEQKTVTAKHVHQKVPPSIEQKQKQAQYAKYKEMGLRALMELSLDDLRQYATYGLHIVGASKIPGGKAAIAERIIAERDGTPKKRR